MYRDLPQEEPHEHDVHNGGSESDEEEEGSSDGDEQHEQLIHRALQGTNRTVLELGESVYDEALIVPLLKGAKMRAGKWKFRSVMTVLSTCTLLSLNLLLQGLVLAKVSTLSEATEARNSGALWEVCEGVSDGAHGGLDFKKLLEVRPASGNYFDCGPLSITLLSSTNRLDRDGDGFWTLTEAGDLQDYWEGRLKREANLRMVFAHFQEAARQSLLEAQKGKNLSESLDMTSNFTRFPMAWLQQEENKIDLCAAGDPNICGNLEVRNILKSKISETDRDSRIAACEDILDNYCAMIFGERYRLYSVRTSELCGNLRTSWDLNNRVRTIVYEKSHKYANREDGIIRPQYFLFLFVILMIWFLAMLNEMRELTSWWFVILNYPDQVGKEEHLIEISTESIKINAIPKPHKYITIVVNLLPRTVIWAGLTLVGSRFLIRADDYTDLILNSVALAFLIDIDNMLYSALVSEKCKKMLGKCEPFKVDLPVSQCIESLEKNVGTTFIYTAALIALVVGLIVESYWKEGGKYDIGTGLSCICQVAGTSCLGAQLLGGLPNVPGQLER